MKTTLTKQEKIEALKEIGIEASLILVTVFFAGYAVLCITGHIYLLM